MIDPVRQEILSQAQTIVVKVGTNVLTGADGTLDPARMQSLADQLQRMPRCGPQGSARELRRYRCRRRSARAGQASC